MCDYCACREHPLFERLGDDHAQLLAWAKRIETAVDAGDLEKARAGMGHLLAVLDPHLELEERSLLPALAADDVFTATVAGIAEDHHRARTSRPDVAMADPMWVAATRTFLAELRAHIHVEEYDVFPAASQLLDSALWVEAESLASAA